MKKSQKISTQIIISFGIVILLTLILGIGAIIVLSIISKDMKAIYENNLLGVQYIETVSTQFEMSRQSYMKASTGALIGDQTLINGAEEELGNMISSLNSNIQKYEDTGVPSEASTILAQLKKDIPDYKSAAKNFLNEINKLMQGNEDIDFQTPLNDLKTVAERISKHTDDLVEIESNLAKNAYDNSTRTSNIVNITSIILLVIIIGVSFIVTHNITTSIESRLKMFVEKLTASTKIIDTSASQLSEASEILASGSSRQAAAIEETSATMNESSSMIAQNAENTRQATILAEHANVLASKGMEKMDSMVLSMNELRESSNNIGRIVKTIDEIAFQTNLLAINATVEAARAGGDAGRSFAVVAQEVRNLAQRSAQAAADTTEIIEKNVALTYSSGEESRSVADSLKEVTEEFEKLSRLINEINAAGEEQASGIKQINIAISQMEKVTQENAAVAQENAASSTSMIDETKNLSDAVDIARSMIGH